MRNPTCCNNYVYYSYIRPKNLEQFYNMDKKATPRNMKSVISSLKSTDEKERSRALEEIYVSYYPVVEKFIQSNGGEGDDAKDIFQEGITVLFTQISNEKFRGDANVKTYLFSICKNLWYKHIKRRKSMDLEKAKPQITEFSYDEIEQNDKVVAVFQLFNTLGQDCQRLLELFYFEKLSMTKIAEAFNFAGAQSAKNKKVKCLKKLRSLIEANPSVHSLFVKQ